MVWLAIVLTFNFDSAKTHGSSKFIFNTAFYLFVVVNARYIVNLKVLSKLSLYLVVVNIPFVAVMIRHRVGFSITSICSLGKKDKKQFYYFCLYSWKKSSTLLVPIMSYTTSSPSCTIPGRIGWTETLGAYCTNNVTFAAFLFLDEWNPKESSTAGKSSASFEASHLRIKYQFCYIYQNWGSRKFYTGLIAVVDIN